MAGIPIYAPNVFPAAYGFITSVASNTTLAITPGFITSFGVDSQNTFCNFIQMDSAALLNSARVGLNGIDNGVLEASTLYGVYAIGCTLQTDPSATDKYATFPAGTLLSKNLTMPSLPYNYDLYRLIGYVYTDGSTHFIPQLMIQQGSARIVQYDTGISVLSGGSSATYDDVALTGAVPIVDGRVWFSALFDVNTAGDSANIRPTGSSSTNGIEIFTSSVITAPQGFPNFDMTVGHLLTVPSIDYKVTASSALTLLVTGYAFSL